MPHVDGDEEDLATLMRDAMESRVSQVNTCMPGVVVSYDHTAQTANVRPALQRPMMTQTGAPMAERLPDVIPSCPVVFPRTAGGAVLHIPLKEGDSVLLLFTQWDMSEWRRLGGAHVETGAMTSHPLGSAVVIAGLFPADAPVAGLSATDVLLGTPGGVGVKMTATHMSLGHAGHPMKRAARSGDPVSVNITSANIAGRLIANLTTGAITVVPGMDPIPATGTITDGSPTVDISD